VEGKVITEWLSFLAIAFLAIAAFALISRITEQWGWRACGLLEQL
jgi:hypothetical protein